MKHLITILFYLTLVNVHAQVYTVKSVPNDKLTTGSYVSNPDHILEQSTVANIDQQLKQLEDQTTVQVAVVAIRSIGDEDVFDFAQGLFQEWGIGNAGNDNGFLILLVLDKRTIRFHTGYGLEGVLPDATTKWIQETYMVPQFKNDDYDAGILAGLNEVVKVLSDPVYAQELAAMNENNFDTSSILYLISGIVGSIAILIIFLVMRSLGKFRDSIKQKNVLYPEMRLSQKAWLVEYAMMPIIVLSVSYLVDFTFEYFLLFIYAYFIIVLIHKRIRMEQTIKRLKSKTDYFGIVGFYGKYQVFWLFMAFIFPLPFLLHFMMYLSEKRTWRNHPRNCKNCNGKLNKLDEKNEDAYMTAGQIFEENLKSVDYDIWLCPECAQTQVLHYVNNWSKYDNCPKCKTRAYYHKSSQTISSPSYTSTGTGEKSYHCKFCNYSHASTYTIPMLTRSESSSSSSGSSSGGSWGGGSSGGGGSSSSW